LKIYFDLAGAEYDSKRSCELCQTLRSANKMNRLYWTSAQQQYWARTIYWGYLSGLTQTQQTANQAELIHSL